MSTNRGEVIKGCVFFSRDIQRLQIFEGVSIIKAGLFRLLICNNSSDEIMQHGLDKDETKKILGKDQQSVSFLETHNIRN